jgi:hypothetical protein
MKTGIIRDDPVHGFRAKALSNYWGREATRSALDILTLSSKHLRARHSVVITLQCIKSVHS